MKKLILAVLLPILAFQLQLCPRHWLPNDWVASYEYGKKWTQLLMGFYSVPAAIPLSSSSVEIPIGQVSVSMQYFPVTTPCNKFMRISVRVEKDVVQQQEKLHVLLNEFHTQQAAMNIAVMAPKEAEIRALKRLDLEQIEFAVDKQKHLHEKCKKAQTVRLPA